MPNFCVCTPGCTKPVNHQGWRAVSCLRLIFPEWKSFSQSEKDDLKQGTSQHSAAKNRVYQKEYREEHKEELAAYQKEYRAEHKEELAAQRKEYREGSNRTFMPDFHLVNAFGAGSVPARMGTSRWCRLSYFHTTSTKGKCFLSRLALVACHPQRPAATSTSERCVRDALLASGCALAHWLWLCGSGYSASFSPGSQISI